jgi:lipoate-protein ligase A
VPEAVSKLTVAFAGPQTWLLLRSDRAGAAENMALDEALVHESARLRQPLLRFYAWAEPAATFGYFQKYAEVARLTPLRPLVRRPTGGGVVPHDADWTYSLVLPPTHRWYGLRAVESYRLLHEWLQAAFARIKIRSELSPVCRKDLAGQCFAGAEKFDLLWQGRKMAGAAQRRSREGLLIQGSLQPPSAVPRSDWENALCETARIHWGVRWRAFEVGPELQECARRLAAEKYSQAAYNQRR